MNVLYLSPDMRRYDGAMYQQDVIAEIGRQCSVTFYGPGFPLYNKNDSISEAIAKCPSKPDWIIIGHAWLRDTDGHPSDQFAHIDLAATNLPKALIYNKEYANADAKAEFIRRVGIDVAFTHHHEPERLQERTGVPFHFWPFAFDERRFFSPVAAKTYHLGFSRILQNPTPGRQSDLRVRLMQELFECDGDIPLAPRRAYEDGRFFWNALPRDARSRSRSTHLGKYRRLSEDDYANVVRSCMAFVCTRSPADLVSPRYFECMASRTLVLAEPNSAHARIFRQGTFIEFSSVDEFGEQVRAILRDGVPTEIVEWAHLDAMQHHSWRVRVAQLLGVLRGSMIPA
jgi:hypothetical protein